MLIIVGAASTLAGVYLLLGLAVALILLGLLLASYGIAAELRWR